MSAASPAARASVRPRRTLSWQPAPNGWVFRGVLTVTVGRTGQLYAVYRKAQDGAGSCRNYLVVKLGSGEEYHVALAGSGPAAGWGCGCVHGRKGVDNPTLPACRHAAALLKLEDLKQL